MANPDLKVVSALTGEEEDNTSPDTLAVRRLQQEWALSTIGGELRVISLRQVANFRNQKEGVDVFYYKLSDADLMLRRAIEAMGLPVTKPSAVIQQFKDSPLTKVFNSVSSCPDEGDEDTLCLWRNLACNPEDGKWPTIRKFLEDVICSSDNKLFLYLLRYLAHMLQTPAEKPGIFIVLYGEEGVGKGFFSQLLQRIWGRSVLIVQSIDSVVGAFNNQLEQGFIVWLDEAMFEGAKAQNDKLKSLITEPYIQISGKYQPTRNIKSPHRWFASTNRKRVAEVRHDDRRQVPINVANTYKQDIEYFGALANVLEDGTEVNAFVHQLLNLDISTFEPRNRPKTAEVVNQKILSLAGFTRYWYEVLVQGEFSIGCEFIYRDTSWIEPKFLRSADIKQCYLRSNKQAERYESIQERAIYSELAQICPSANKVRQDNRHGLSLPHIDVARAEFEQWIGDKLSWD